MLVDSFLEDEELTRTALSCHLSMDLLCQEMRAAWKSWACRKVGNKMLKWRCALAVLFSLLRKGGICLQTTGMLVLHRVDSLALVVLQFLRHVSTTPLSLKALSKINKTGMNQRRTPEKVKPMTWERPEAQMWRPVVANAADHWQFRREACKDPRRLLTKRGDFRDFRTDTCLMNISWSIARCTHRHSCLQSFCPDQV